MRRREAQRLTACGSKPRMSAATSSKAYAAFLVSAKPRAVRCKKNCAAAGPSATAGGRRCEKSATPSMWWEEAARKGKAPPLEWPALSPLQPLRFRGQPPPASEGGPRRAERIGSVRFGSDRFGRSPQGLNDMRLHRAVPFCCRSCLAMLCRKQLLVAEEDPVGINNG